MTPLRLGPVKRGDTWDLACTLRQTTGGAPVDLTGCAAALQVRHAQTDAWSRRRTASSSTPWSAASP
jgi:hypothetical protein